MSAKVDSPKAEVKVAAPAVDEHTGTRADDARATVGDSAIEGSKRATDADQSDEARKQDPELKVKMRDPTESAPAEEAATSSIENPAVADSTALAPENARWESRWHPTYQAWYWEDTVTGHTQWDISRVPATTAAPYSASTSVVTWDHGYGTSGPLASATLTTPATGYAPYDNAGNWPTSGAAYGGMTATGFGAPGTTGYATSGSSGSAPVTTGYAPYGNAGYWPTSGAAYGDLSSTAFAAAPGTTGDGTAAPPRRLHGGYNPAIHGSYDPEADYAREAQREQEEQDRAEEAAARARHQYEAMAYFNSQTGTFQHASINAEYHNDEHRSRRQLNAFFDVDAAANSHNGRSLKAERSGKKISKKEYEMYKAKKAAKKAAKRNAWLKD